MRMLLTALALITWMLGWNRVEAATISVDAELSHEDLSIASPIEFTWYAFPVRSRRSSC